MTGDLTAHVVAVFNHMFALMQQDGQVEQTAAAILTIDRHAGENPRRVLRRSVERQRNARR
mgnify:CR=1 FL=1